MGKIVLLDDLTINQIAAGEVIERPSSVVKELTENSIDAGAKNITIEIKNGGISYIRITDDGSGIEKDDMEIAFERHATSKIRKAEDLDNVKSMGFRGEALASIASIATVKMVSRTKETDYGYQITLKGGNIIEEGETGAKLGTTITVSELFYNTPVRYKFLKKDFTESGYIEDVVTRIALANPSVAIKLINMGKIVIQTNGTGKIEDVVYSIYGKEVYDNILKVEYEFEGYKVTGVIGKPIISRSNRSNQLFFVNHRFVKDKILTSAAEQGFKGLVTIGKHGFLILNIDMDPKKVDVNVHPTKLEVRFQDEGVVFKAVYHAIKETLLKSDLVSNPVKDYSDSNINSDKELEKLTTEATRGITNKDRVAAWSIDGSIKDTEKNYEELNKENDSAVVKPEFNEFKNSITDLDENTRKTFIDELTKAKTPEEINKELSRYSELLRKKNEKSEETKDEKENNGEMNLENHNDESSKEENDVNENSNEEKEDASKEISNKNIEESSEEYLTNNKKEDSQVENKEDNKEENKEDSQIENKEESKEEQEAENEPQNEKEKFEEMYKKLFGRDIETAQKEYEDKKKEEEKENIIKPINDNEISLFSNEETLPYQFVGIAFKTYIILTINDDLYIIDQHAAHERIMYEKVKKNYYSDTEKDCQMMLLPDVITLNNKEMGIFRDNKEMFNRAGFLVEEFGDNTIKLTGVPEFCLKFNTKEIFLETLDELDTVARTAKQELEDKFLATVACKAAVKAHMALSKMEVDSLMKQLLKLPNPFSCPHGRPTAIKMTKNDIEKKFSRRQ